MAAATGPTAPPAGGGGGGPLSFMGCMREASPPPAAFDEHASPGQHFYQHHHHHLHHQQQQQQRSRPAGLPTGGDYGFDSMPKEPKKRRFHPLRGLRRIFRRKSRGAADAPEVLRSGPGDASGKPHLGTATSSAECGRIPDRSASSEHLHHRHHHHHLHQLHGSASASGGILGGIADKEEVTVKDPAGRAVVDEIRSRSASELLTDSSLDRDRLFLRRRGMEESYANFLRPTGGQLSVSHDSVFPGEVLHPHARPLSSLDLPAASLERRTASNDSEHKESSSSQATTTTTAAAQQQRHRISLRVLEQIKTVIENRNQVAAADRTDNNNSSHNRFASRDRSEQRSEDTQAKILKKDATTSPTNNNNDALLPPPPASPLKEDLPEITNGVLNHDAALHRISVRPKNRRPPRRATPTSSNNSSLNTSNGNLNSTTSTNGLPRIDSASEISIDTLDSLEGTLPPETAQPSTPIPQEQPPSPSSPVVPSKPIPILRKSSSRLSRNSEVFEELEAKLRKPPVSPDSLDIKDHLDSSRTSADVLEVGTEVVKPPKPSPRTASVSSDDRVMTPITASSPSDRRRRVSSNRLSKSPDSLEGTSPGWFTKSNEGFDKLLSEYDRNSTASNTSLVNLNTSTVSVNRDQKPVAAARKLLVKPISKSQERVCCTKSSDSLEALEASDDSMERRRSSFEIRNRRVMSKSTECFDSSLIEHQQQLIAAKAEEKRKRASVSEMNLSRGGNRHSKVLSKSSESFEAISNLVESHFEKSTPAETEKPQNVWRVNRRITNSSESSDNLDLEENCKLENRNKQVRRSNPKRLSTGSANMNFSVDVADQDSSTVLSRKPPSRLQKSSESSELGSTDTLDSERRNTLKSSDSDETLDSLEKDLQESPDRKDDEDWRRRASSQENLDIQLLAYTLVSKVIQENGNSHHEVEEQRNDKNNHEEKTEETSHQVAYPKKKLQLNQQSSSSEDNKINLSSTFNNLLSSTKNDEDLQNMLNGNISEVSTESTKSFKEKLIMFEKLGK